ncbi:hypothetical protein EYD45_05900 [Hyunsoonleella flava]|uniref:Lipoprotein n=1 Tax=Hyunsoonleella flava TaxID=2527939 RepID=A0A4Q9FI89_9FLAO|nr:hypothetical protein [Hyunsoonleella flava]TBN04792.1 hypothetical protein EYD45_05900 [Hyunsoonleella flava]
MIKFVKVSLLFSLLLLFSCPSDDEDACTKTIIVQFEQTISGPSGITFIPEITQEVPCDFPEPEVVEPIDQGNALTNFSYEVISFVFTPDTGNNTSRLQFEIKLNNENDFVVKGVPVLTIDSDNIQFSTSYSNDAIAPCYEIQANSSCNHTYDKETPLDPNLGPPPSKFDLVSVKYVLK